MASVTVSDLRVRAGNHDILTGVDLVVADAEFVVLMGPSGSGKTTLLRAIAGFEAAESGGVWVGDLPVAAAEPQVRGVAMMFQDNVLFPFATAEKNVAFPLVTRGVDRDEVNRRVQAEARVLSIQHLLGKQPDQLSAGYQQLVQAARVMVQVPELFLMDEPVARMDPKLREVARRELSLLQKGYGVTTIWATNDPVEAMAIADRIVVLDGGRVIGIGPPADLYRRPPTEVVAHLLGLPPICVVPGWVEHEAGRSFARVGPLRLASAAVGMGRLAPGPVRVGIRPEDVVLRTGGVPATVLGVEYLGDHQVLQIGLDGVRFAVRASGDLATSVGSSIEVVVVAAHFFDPHSGVAVAHETYGHRSA